MACWPMDHDTVTQHFQNSVVKISWLISQKYYTLCWLQKYIWMPQTTHTHKKEKKPNKKQPFAWKSTKYSPLTDTVLHIKGAARLSLCSWHFYVITSGGNYETFTAAVTLICEEIGEKNISPLIFAHRGCLKKIRIDNTSYLYWWSK